MEEYLEKFKTVITDFAPSVIGALLMLIVGLIAIRFILKLVNRIMKNRGVEETLQKFVANLLGWTLKILLFVMVISKLGIETTSFAAILASAGLAIGLALQGSLGNFAGGILIMIFKPFKIGDLIDTQEVIGVVKEIQIFTTTLLTPENKTAIIPNGALSNGNIINLTTAGKLRVDLTIGVGYDEDIKEAKKVLLETLLANPKTLKDPAPTVSVSELADSSVNFAVRPWSTTDNYWDVYFETLENCKEALDKAGIEIPYPHAVEIVKEA